MANEVFISYSRKDFEKVRDVKDEIDHLVGITCWMDLDGIESGELFKKVIISAINRHDTLLFMLTPQSMGSPYAMKELGFAASKGKRIVLVDLEYTQMNDEFLFDYSDKDIVNWNDPLQHDKLIKNLKSWFPAKDSAPEKYPTLFAKDSNRLLHVFFLVDCSGSMMGRRINEVNLACSEALKNFDVINPDIEIRVNVLMFDNTARWMCNVPTPVEEFIWTPIEPGGLTCFGEACRELNQKMNQKAYFAGGGTILRSLIILMTDGLPTDDYEKSLQLLLCNRYFIHSNRFAIGMGDGYDLLILKKFAGAKKVFEYKDENSSLKPLIERIMHIGLYAASYSALVEEEEL